MNDMGKLKQPYGLCILIFFLSFFFSQAVWAKADLTTIRQKILDVQPIDVTVSEDASLIFILSLKELIVYSAENDQIISRSPLDGSYDNICYSGKDKTLILTGRASKTLKLIRFEQIHDISLSGLPFKGPLDAAVTLAIFDDYQ